VVPDYDCVPGLERPVTLSEYAKLEGLREADVLAVIGQFKIPAVFFRGQWFVEAPPNCQGRLAQLRDAKQPLDNAEKATHEQSEETQCDSEVERLRIGFVKSHWRYNMLTSAQQEALLSTKQYAERPGSIDKAILGTIDLLLSFVHSPQNGEQGSGLQAR
jgi:hypothetical protein